MKTAEIERPGRVRLKALPPLALYVHIPWCVRKCPYCDFNSHERAGELPEKAYVETLLLDLGSHAAVGLGPAPVSVFIGGGTPSLFSPESIDALLSGVRARLPLEPGAEITLEANPGTVEAARFRGFRDAGVNRISIGVQSFDDRMLARARPHPSAPTRRGAPSRRRSRASTTSTSTSCTACRGRASDMARADIERGGARRRAARLGLPAHHRAEHRVLQQAAAASRARRVRRHAGRGRGDALADRLSSTMKPRRSRRPGHALPAQPQLLGIRRLPRHRRRRARQDQLPRPHHAPRARASSRRMYLQEARGGGTASSSAARAAVRVHAERAAPGRRVSRRALHRAHRACRSPRCSRRSNRPRAQGLLERDLQAHPADRARPALPQRAAGAFPARRNTSSRIG